MDYNKYNKYNKQKKIRSKLINFTNQQLKIRKTKNIKFLINSISLEELEKKNLQCKEFIIVEKPQVYQNINNNSIVEHIYINNNSFISNIIIYPLSSRIINKEKNNIVESDYNNLNISSFVDYSKEKKEKILQNISKGLFYKKQKNLESPPNYQPCLIKKELMERKIKMFKNNEINSHNFNYYNKENKEKEINENKKEITLSKQLSSETIATEISRIIKICYYEKSIISSGISRSNSKIEENDEIKKAKQFAKKLKYYCYTLKNKFPIKENIIKYKKIENKKNDLNLKDIKNNDNKDKYNNFEDKINYHKIKNKKYKIKHNYIKKLSEKIKIQNKHISHDNLNIIKFIPPTKRMKSERNIKVGRKKNNSILSEDNYNNNTEQSTNAQYQYKTIENDSKNKNKINTNILRASKKAKKKLTEQTKTTEQNEKKSPSKMKKEVIPNLFIKKIKNKIADINKREKKRKKDKKNTNIINNNKKNELPSIVKNKNIKRQSIDIRMFGEGKGLESIIFDTKNLSTSEDIPFIQDNNKKRNTINSKTKKNNIINNGPKNSSKMNKKKNIKKKNNNNQILNTLQNNQEIRKSYKKSIHKINTFHIKKKKNALNLSKKADKKRKLSAVNNEKEEKIINNNTIDFGCKKKVKKKITFKLDEDFSIKINDNYNNEESEDLNLLDDYLYNKKIKRIKNTKKISHN